jgi:hypothetical protein
MTGGGTRWVSRLGDLLRVLALVSAAVTVLSPPQEIALRFALILGLLLVTRAVHMPRLFDAAFAGLLLASAWANALNWYFQHPWIDIPIHFALTGATARCSSSPWRGWTCCPSRSNRRRARAPRPSY